MDLLLPLLVALLAAAALAARTTATPVSLVVTAVAGVAGLVTPLPRARRTDGPEPRSEPVGRTWAEAWWWLAVTLIGVGAFAAGRVLSTPLLGPAAPTAFVTTAAAGIAEELLFRRLLYGCLAPAGAAVAVGGSALVFAAVHIPAYGLPAFPLDLAAGLLFGWQRWASGRWTSPAVTHALANVIQLL